MFFLGSNLALCAPDYGSMEEKLFKKLQREVGLEAHLVRTAMAGGNSSWERQLFKRAGIRHFETREDLELLVSYLLRQPETGGFVLLAHVCEWRAMGGDLEIPFGKHQVVDFDKPWTLQFQKVPSIACRIKRERPELIVVDAFTVAGKTEEGLLAAIQQHKMESGADFVYANDAHNLCYASSDGQVFPNRKLAMENLVSAVIRLWSS